MFYCVLNFSYISFSNICGKIQKLHFFVAPGKFVCSKWRVGFNEIKQCSLFPLKRWPPQKLQNCVYFHAFCSHRNAYRMNTVKQGNNCIGTEFTCSVWKVNREKGSNEPGSWNQIEYNCIACFAPCFCITRSEMWPSSAFTRCNPYLL